MRTKNAALNLILYFIYEIALFALGMIFPRFIIQTYGSEINGLASTITRLLSLVNLIQAGAVGAAVFQMYGPVAKKDYEEQSAILYSSRKYYNKISVVYFFIAIVIGFVSSFVLKSETLQFYEILIAFVIFALSGTFPLVFTSQFDIYITPHQKSYYLKISSLANIFVYYSLLTITLLLKWPFLLIYVDALIGSATGALFNFYFYKKLTRGKINRNPKNKTFVISNRKFLLLSTIGTEVVSALPQIIISNVVGLVYTSVFSVYSMIFVSMKTVLNSISYSFVGTFGNLVKTSNDNRVREVFNCISLITMALGTVLASCTAFLIMPFVEVYTSGIADVNYIYQSLGIMVSIYIMILSFRLAFSFVTTVYGLFKQVCVVTITTSIISSVLSIICTIAFGMPYVMVGLISNQVICSIGIIIILKKNVKWFRISELIRRLVSMFAITAFFYSMYVALDIKNSSIWNWLIVAIICFCASVLIELIYCLIFERKDLHSVLSYIKLAASKKAKS